MVSEALQEDHEVLEIDGDRLFEYENTYFDTPAYDCFHDHIQDRTPRYKMRTRYYVTTGTCIFEVKVKLADGETVKRQTGYEPDDRHTVRPGARELLSETLEACDMRPPEDEIQSTLITRFQRVTIAAVDRPARTTIDFGLELDAPDGRTATIEDSLAIVETKTPEGEGQADEILQDAGVEPVSLSKYRLGTGLVVAPDEDRGYAPDLKALFAVT